MAGVLFFNLGIKDKETDVSSLIQQIFLEHILDVRGQLYNR